MNEYIPKFLDSYDRPARLYPGLMVFVPLAVLLVCLYGTENIVSSSILSILGFSGVAYAIGRVARDSGKRIQEKLFKKWGGAPSTQMLRHSDTSIDVHTKERYHRIVGKGIGKSMPDAETESNNPVVADELYRAATVWLIEKTRNTKMFPLVFKENVAFGFHRNALGLRLAGVVISILSFIWILFHAKAININSPFFILDNILAMTPASAIALVVSAVMLLMWGLFFGESALKRVGFSYAERLLQSCDMLDPEA